MESYLDSEKFKEGVKKVGPGSKFWYRCRYDPVPTSAVKKSYLSKLKHDE